MCQESEQTTDIQKLHIKRLPIPATGNVLILDSSFNSKLHRTYNTPTWRHQRLASTAMVPARRLRMLWAPHHSGLSLEGVQFLAWDKWELKVASYWAEEPEFGLELSKRWNLRGTTPQKEEIVEKWAQITVCNFPSKPSHIQKLRRKQ